QMRANVTKTSQNACLRPRLTPGEANVETDNDHDHEDDRAGAFSRRIDRALVAGRYAAGVPRDGRQGDARGRRTRPRRSLPGAALQRLHDGRGTVITPAHLRTAPRACQGSLRRRAPAWTCMEGPSAQTFFFGSPPSIGPIIATTSAMTGSAPISFNAGAES